MAYGFKFKKADAPTKLAAFFEKPNWRDLTSKITRLFHISSDNVGVAFVVKGREIVAVDNEEELQSFYALHEGSGIANYKFVVQDLRAPDTAITSTWSKDSNLSDLAKSDDVLKLFCWFLDGSSDPFSVDIGASKIVDDLKKAISRRKYNSDSLTLWELNEPEPVDPDDTLAERMKSRGNNVTTFAKRLSSGNKLSTVFPQLPLEDRLYILVQRSSTVIITPSSKDSWFSNASLPSGSNLAKRNRSSDVGREETKKPRIDDVENDASLPSESALGQLHERLQNIKHGPNLYSDPRNMTTFPFPFIYGQVPSDRFHFQSSYFEYMGRTAFSELWDVVHKLKLGQGYTRLYIQGTMGYGKSHILAVLAGLLSSSGKRTVYLPDCRELLASGMSYMKSALLCAFADPPSSNERDIIRALESEDKVVNFCHRHVPMYFIIDQMNVLDCEGHNMDTINNRRKVMAQTYLDRLTSGHYRITSASANHETAKHMTMKQTGEIKLPLLGGMSKAEMKWWRIHHKEKVPIFGGDDKARVEDLTGRIPLLLDPLLSFAKKPFHDIEQAFWTHRDLADIGNNVRLFAADKMLNESQNYEQFYLPTLAGCLTASSVSMSHPKWFDYRYFYPDNGLGNCTCGLAREAAAAVIRQGSPGLLCSRTWLNSLRTFKDNPSVVGFLVEQACLSAISKTGFHHGRVNWDSFPATIFRGDLVQAIPPTDCEIFLIPENPFFKDIDALYLKVDVEKATALVVPIQITVAKTHKDSEAAFYSRWSVWEEFFEGYQVETAFVWVVENKQSWAVKEREFQTLRNCLIPLFPKHEQIFITVADISSTLGRQLKAIR